MRKPVATVKCTHVVAQVGLGFYDADGNLVGEEMFPQVEGSVLVGKLFYPHTEQLANLIATCIEQAWAKLNAQAPTDLLAPGGNGAEPPGQCRGEGSLVEPSTGEAVAEGG